MYSDLDQRGFELLKLLESREMPGSAGQPEQPPKIGEEVIMDLGEIKDLKYLKTDLYGANISVFQAIESSLIGLSEANYVVFGKLVTEIHERSPFAEKATYSFIESHAFEWLINVYKENRASQSLTAFLLSLIDEECREYAYYFKLHPFVLATPFKIGETEISFFTDEFLQQEETKFLQSGKPKKEFDDLFKPFRNKAIVKISKRGVQERAAELAVREGELIVDVLRCLLHEYAVMGQYVLPDLDHRFKPKNVAVHLYNHAAENFTFGATISNRGPVIPIEVNAALMKDFKQKKIRLFEKFISAPKDNEFHYTVSETIKSFSELVSVQNKYDKIVKLISLFESVVIDKSGKRGYGETIIKQKLIPKMLKDTEHQLGVELTGYFFRIRDAYIHHGIEKHVDFNKLYQFQKVAFIFLTFLLQLNEHCHSMEAFYEILNKE
jgi:hypothetical protein